MKRILIALVIALAAVGNAAAQDGPARRLAPSTFANLGTPPNGSIRYCTDCAATSPCTGAGTGATASRLSGVWNCSDGGAGSSLPVTDTTSIAKGSGDATKQVRLEVDGFTTGTTHIVTPPNADISTVGTLNVYFDATGVGNTGTAETDLATYTLPANALNANGKTLRVTAVGSYANNASVKTVKIYFGATSLFVRLNTIASTGNWRLVAYISRTGAATQVANVIGGAGNLAASESINGNEFTTPAETLSGTVVVKVTGTSNTASNDVIVKGFIVEILN